MLQVSVRRIIAAGFLLWFLLTWTTLYFLHFKSNTGRSVSLQSDLNPHLEERHGRRGTQNLKLTSTNQLERVYLQDEVKSTEEFHTTLKQDVALSAEVTSAEELRTGSIEDVALPDEVTSAEELHTAVKKDTAFPAKTSTVSIKETRIPYEGVHKVSKLSSTRVPHSSTMRPTMVSLSSLRLGRHKWRPTISPTAAKTRGHWEKNVFVNGKNLRYSPYRHNITEYISRLSSSRMALKYRRWYSAELKVAQQYCSSNTCVLLSDTFPNGSVDIEYYNQIRCFAKAIDMLQKSILLANKTKNCTCGLGSGKDSTKVVGLVSLPGSGNTWLRGLLEEATHVCTGSMWCDINLRATQFCAEGMRGTRTLVVKNHDPLVRWRGQSLPPKNYYTSIVSEETKPEFDAVVFLHRNLYRAIIAERHRSVARSLWNKQFQSKNYTNISSNDHVLFFGEEHFGNNSEWNETIYRLAETWKDMVNHLLIGSRNRPVLVVHFEDLKRNIFEEVRRILTFVGYEIEDFVLRERLKHNFNAFYRNHTDSFDHFTPEQREYVDSVISSIDPQIATKLKIVQATTVDSKS